MSNEKVILQSLMGSRSVGTSQPDSDYDYMSVVLPGDDYYLGMGNWGSQGTKEAHIDSDGCLVESVQYELRKFLRMCSNFNPNVIPMLYVNPSCYDVICPLGRELVENRDMFTSTHCYHTFSGYAYNQFKRITEKTEPTGKMGAKRKELRERYGIDLKFSYHAIRLMRMLNEFLRSNGKEMNVWRSEIDAYQLLEIRNGAYTLDAITDFFNKEYSLAKTLLSKTTIPTEPDHKRINDFCRKVLRTHLEID